MKKLILIILMLVASISLQAQYRGGIIHTQPRGYPEVCAGQDRPPSPKYTKYRAKLRKKAYKAGNKRARQRERERKQELNRLSRRS